MNDLSEDCYMCNYYIIAESISNSKGDCQLCSDEWKKKWERFNLLREAHADFQRIQQYEEDRRAERLRCLVN